MITSQTLLDSVTYGTPSGNYDGSSQDWASDAVQAADYYRGRGSIQTLAIHVTEFEGTIRIQATLDAEADKAAWFDIYVYGDGSTIPLTDHNVNAIMGNFVWLRARVEGFSGGTIDFVTASY